MTKLAGEELGYRDSWEPSVSLHPGDLVLVWNRWSNMTQDRRKVWENAQATCSLGGSAPSQTLQTEAKTIILLEKQSTEENSNTQGWGTAVWINFLLCKHKNLISSPHTPHKSASGAQTWDCGGRDGRPWYSRGSKASQINETLPQIVSRSDEYWG